MTQRVIEKWKIDEVRRYLEDRFAEHEIDNFPRGNQTAHLFRVLKKNPKGEREVVHQLLITKKFFDRITEPLALRQALIAGEVVLRMIRLRDRTVELH